MAKKNVKKRMNPNQPYKVGKTYLIRTVTNHIAGKILFVGRLELVVSDAAWIADTGRFADAVKSGVFSEVEPYPEGSMTIVSRGSIVDAVQIPPTAFTQK